MRRNLALLVAFLLGAGLATAVAQKSPDSTIIDPDVHQVVFENDHVRVLEARAAPGQKSPMHSHPPILVVSVGSARIKFTLPDGSTLIRDLRPGQVLWLDGVEHSWELLAGNLHVIGVEVKSAQKAEPK
jgi:quercetin dioxygenase-like cupin family protein